MQEKSDESEIVIDKIVSGRINMNTLKISDNSYLECSSSQHNERNGIREGNRFYLILEKKCDEWELRSAICWKCSVKEEIDKLSSEGNSLAVVESSLVYRHCNDELERGLSDPKVWEIIES